MVVQEEALCYSSTLYPTLKAQYYPWPNIGRGGVAGIYSPAVVIFKDDLDHECIDLEPAERQVVSVITVAAPRSPHLTNGKFLPSTLGCMREKIRLVYRMAAHNGQQYLILGMFRSARCFFLSFWNATPSFVLGAMGCGAYQCPPIEVAEEMRAILLESEFKGWFREVVFAVYATASGKNYDVFKRILDGVRL